METTIQAPAVTAQNGIEIYMNDVGQFNQNVANFLNSVSKYCNNIIKAIASTEKYFTWIDDIASTVYNSELFPIWLSSAITISLFFLILNFIRR